MPRPCDCDRDGCRRCWLARHDGRYRVKWGIPGEPEPVPDGSAFRPARLPPLPCVHLGESLTGYECAAAGVDPRRDWKRCGLGLSVGGSPPGIVCRCKGCGPACAGYTPGDRQD